MHDPDPGPDLPDSYLTLGGWAESELKVQRSRFLGFAGPVADEAEARARIGEIARRHHDARHVCHAWRLGTAPPITEARNDDGEPAGTAGEPLLVALRKAEASDSVVVVVRYFGGIKLGTGGLARAYGEAAAEAVAACGTERILLGREFLVRFPYALQKTVGTLLARHEGRTRDQEFGEDVLWRIWLPHSQWRGFAAGLAEASAGTVVPRRLP